MFLECFGAFSEIRKTSRKSRRKTSRNYFLKSWPCLIESVIASDESRAITTNNTSIKGQRTANYVSISIFLLSLLLVPCESLLLHENLFHAKLTIIYYRFIFVNFHVIFNLRIRQAINVARMLFETLWWLTRSNSLWSQFPPWLVSHRVACTYALCTLSE